jgi:hypothetical protein
LGFPRLAGLRQPGDAPRPYHDYGLITIAPITGSGGAQAVATVSYNPGAKLVGIRTENLLAIEGQLTT